MNALWHAIFLRSVALATAASARQLALWAVLRRAAVTAAWVAIASVSLSACALGARADSFPPGTPATELMQRLGPPTARYPADAGGAVAERWQYSTQPSGRYVYNIDLDAQGRVLRAEQALSESLFAQRIQPGRWTREDVLREYGPPARQMRVHNFDGVIWVWRYLEAGNIWRELFIDLHPDGRVHGYATGDEPMPDAPERSR